MKLFQEGNQKKRKPANYDTIPNAVKYNIETLDNHNIGNFIVTLFYVHVDHNSPVDYS